MVMASSLLALFGTGVGGGLLFDKLSFCWRYSQECCSETPLHKLGTVEKHLE